MPFTGTTNGIGYRRFAKPEKERRKKESPMASTATNTAKPPLRLMKLRQAAVYLNYSPSQLRILVQQGQIPYLPGRGQNGAWRFDLRDLDAFIEREKKRV